MPHVSSPHRAAALVIFACSLALAGCGSSKHGASSTGSTSSQANVSQGQTSAGQFVADVPSYRAADFPSGSGETIDRLLGTLSAGPHLALANSIFTPGPHQRLAFALIDNSNRFVLAEAAVYVAPSVTSPVKGPFPAPLDSIYPAAPFRSKTVAEDPQAKTAVYYSSAPVQRAGPYAVLVVARINGKLYGSLTGFKAVAHSRIPNVGQLPPRIDTPTLASVHGNVSLIDTRDPPDDMHKVNFKDVLGRRPVALVIATPLLCQSRLCGPVVDIALQMQSIYGKRMEFIHQEVYANNQIQDGLRPQLQAFHLETEPWLFTFNRQGRVAARLEGAFGIKEFQQAVQAALQ